MIDHKSSISSWATQSREMTLEYCHFCESDLSTYKEKMDSGSFFVLLQLAISCQHASEAALLLIHNKFPWEAEVSIRAVLEGSVKYAFLCTGNEADRKQKAIEYWHNLPDIYELKRSDKASHWLSQVENPELSEWKPIHEVIMGQEKSDEIRLKYPKKTQDALIRKWSVNNILLSFKNSEESINQVIYRGFSGALFGYDIASHIIHQDGDCIGLQWDRINREPRRRIPLEKAHAARELTQIITLAQNRAAITRHMLKVEIRPLIDSEERYKSLMLDMIEVKSHWSLIEYGNHTG